MSWSLPLNRSTRFKYEEINERSVKSIIIFNTLQTFLHSCCKKGIYHDTGKSFSYNTDFTEIRLNGRQVKILGRSVPQGTGTTVTY